MKKTMKQLLAICLALILMASIAGCKSDTEEVAKATDETATTEEATAEAADAVVELEPVELSIGFWGGADVFVEGDPILEMIQDKFNVTFSSMGVSWSDYKEKYKLWAAADELPDIFAVDEFNTDTYTSWIEQGVVQQIPSDFYSKFH